MKETALPSLFKKYMHAGADTARKYGGIGLGLAICKQLVRRSEKMAKLREEIVVQKARETKLNKTIHITEETMRAKQMLATMSHKIRSPLSGSLAWRRFYQLQSSIKIKNNS